MAGGRRIVRIAAGCTLVLVASGAGRSDSKPPAFAGLESATTCIPGPVGVGRTSSYRLVWAAAKDNRTPSSRIVYDVYRSSSSGGEHFAAPTYTTRRGATTFATPPLPSAASYYFVVRARDAAGNRDRNRLERLAANLCM